MSRLSQFSLFPDGRFGDAHEFGRNLMRSSTKVMQFDNLGLSQIHLGKFP
jgi:hypothetical protein